jgi:AcrR family transcriptional regulator
MTAVDLSTAVPGPASSRSAQAAHTRERIVDAASEAFVGRGYRATSLREVAAAAGISHPGLLKHFASKDDLLAAVVSRFEESNEIDLASQLEGEDGGSLGFATIARRNEATPGYLALFAALAGEACSAAHPAHAHMRARYERLRPMAADALADAADHGVVDADRDPAGEAIRFIAAWDGLQLLSQYLPGRIDVAAALEAHQDALALPVGWFAPDDPAPRSGAASSPGVAPLVEPASGVSGGYRSGRERRERIVADATALFASEGYGDTSLRDIADRVGVSKSALLHHFPSKEALLGEVLTERDRRVDARLAGQPGTRSADHLRSLPSGAAENAAREPGLIELYAVLSGEAAPSDHPAHAYFTNRFTRAIDSFRELLRAAQKDGDLPSHRDPEFEAVWLIALWDGLQYQWLYDRSHDVAAHLRAHLSDLLPH